MRAAILFISCVLTASAAAHRTPSQLAKTIIQSQLAQMPQRFVACISIDGVDADQAFLSSLRTTGREFVPASKCMWITDVHRGSYYLEPSRKAVLIDVSSNSSNSEVKYVARHHGLWGIFLTLAVAKDKDGWRIVRVLEHVEA